MQKEIYFAGGCFWGVEKYFSMVKGVTETEVGYANGRTENPSYKDVCYRNTGHAETVRVTYESREVSLHMLLELFFSIIDPTSVNRQGNDTGVQYRTGIYYVDETDVPVIMEELVELQKKCSKKIAVEVMPLTNYYPAEAEHQKYLDKNPYGYCHIRQTAFQAAGGLGTAQEQPADQ